MSERYPCVLLLVAFAFVGCSGGSGGSRSQPRSFTENWEQIGPDGGYITDILVNSSEMGEVWLSADDGGGVYRSTDFGMTWAQLESMPPNMSTHSLAIDPTDPSRMYSPNHFGRGFYKSTDAGLTWVEAGFGLPADPSTSETKMDRRLYDLAVDPDTAIVFAALEGGLYRSIDFGETFEEIDSLAVSGGRETDLAARVVVVSDGTGVPAGTVFVGTAEGGVYRGDPTMTETINWSAISPPISALGPPVSALSLTRNELYVGFWEGSVLRTNSFEGPLSFLNAGGPLCGIGCSFHSLIWTKLVAASGDAAATDILYAGTVNPGTSEFGLYRSDDGGATWIQKNTGLDGLSCQSLELDPADSRHLYFGSMGGGIFESLDGGDTWNARSAGVKATISLAFAEDPADPDHLLTAGDVGLGDGTGGFYESYDRGASWQAVTSLRAGVNALGISPADSNVLLAATWRGGIQRSDNGTAGPWTSVLDKDITPARFAYDAVDPCVVYASAYSLRFFDMQTQLESDNGVYTSTDCGATWDQPVSGSGGYYVTPHPTNSLEALAVGEDVYATTDAFSTTLVSLGLRDFSAGDHFSAAAFDPDDPRTVLVGSINSRLYLTRNYDPSGIGVTWREIANPARDVFIRKLTIDGELWYATCWMGDIFSTPDSTEGILFSSNRGRTWRFLDSEMGRNRLVYEHFQSAFDSRCFYVGMWSGGPLRLTMTDAPVD